MTDVKKAAQRGSDEFDGSNAADTIAAVTTAASGELVPANEVVTPPETSAGRLVVTLYGLYARDGDAWLATASIVRMLGELGVDAPAVRSALSRLKGRGVLINSRHPQGAGHMLSLTTEERIAEGDARIFAAKRADASTGWVLVAFSVPEVRRAHRHQLRVALGRLGFGTVAPGLWIAPEHLAAPVRADLARLGLAQYVEVFTSTVIDGDLRAKVAQWWDLPALAESYTGFLQRYAHVAESLEAASADPAQAFVDYIPMLTAWRRLPYLDPGLPLEALPAQWPGAAAEQCFHAVDIALRAPAALRAAALLRG